jgi:filamentous hemagglutinin family protein
MKKHLIILLLFVCVKLFPQQVQQQTNNFNANRADKYKKMKTIGIILFSAGGAIFVGGIVLLVNGIAQETTIQNNYQNQLAAYNNQPFGGTLPYPNQPDDTKAILNEVGGDLLATVGAIAVAGGTTLFIIGKIKQKKWANRVTMVAVPNYFKVAYTF